MALKIRLRQEGRKNRQTYRLVVTDIRAPRDGKYLEMVGWYNPFNEKQSCLIQADRINYWLGLGAQLTPSAVTLISRVAPDLIKELRAKEQARNLKRVQKRRALKKGQAKPAKAPKAAAPKAEAPKAAAPKAAKAPAKKAAAKAK